MKKEYMKPSMKVLKLQHSGIICGSGNKSARSLNSSPEGLNWDDDGLEDSDDLR